MIAVTAGENKDNAVCDLSNAVALAGMYKLLNERLYWYHFKGDVIG